MNTPDIATTRQDDTEAVKSGLIIKRRSRETELRVVRDDKPNGAMRWKIAGLYVNGQRKREFFTTEDAAKRRLQSLKIQRVNLGTRATHIVGGLAEDAVRAESALAPFGVSLLDAVRDYVRCMEKLKGTGKTVVQAVAEFAKVETARRQSLTLAALVESFLADPETKKLSKPYLDDVRKRWRRFQDDLGADVLACDVTPDKVRRWLAQLAVADVTKGNFHRTVSAVFSYAVHGELVSENPFRKVKKPTVSDADAVEVFTPAQMRGLLTKAHEDLIPVLAIGAFAGIRPDELRRLEWEEIDLQGGFIEVKASKSKTGKRRLVTISPTLSAWLASYKARTGTVAPKNERKLRLAAMAAAKVERWPVDVLRHSFASYHLAQHRDMDTTALELGHTTTKMLFQHYRQAVKPDAAKQWWALMPASTRGKIVPMKVARAAVA